MRHYAVWLCESHIKENFRVVASGASQPILWYLYIYFKSVGNSLKYNSPLDVGKVLQVLNNLQKSTEDILKYIR